MELLICDAPAVTIDAILGKFELFGVQLGLESSLRLLEVLGNPHHRVPIVHVAGSNGKGSVCAYLSSALVAAGYRVGRYTSPHLVDWNERICLNDQPIASADLVAVLAEVEAAIAQFPAEAPSPTQFEVITAAMWLYFAQQAVDIAVIEVGLGGRLDATNVCDRPLATIITSLSLEHWQRLGPTLADIAREKAGILKPNCPAFIGELPTEAQTVVAARVAELGCTAVYPAAAVDLGEQRAEYRFSAPPLTYQLPIPGAAQRQNSALAIAALRHLQQTGWQISDEAIAQGIRQTRWPGRLQWVTWRGEALLIDGAHNPDSARVLREYVDSLDRAPVQWVMGMLSTKDHQQVFAQLLRPGDRLFLVPVPGHSCQSPLILATSALVQCPELADCQTHDELFEALLAAQYTAVGRSLTVLCGSLYLLGKFLAAVQIKAG